MAETRADGLRRQLADEIITGQLSPGERLDEREIAARFGLSRTPVREALRQLAAIGLAELRPHRGVIVARPDDDHLAQTFELMADLESLCTRYAATRMSAAERRALEACHLSSGQLVRSGDRERYAAHNIELHGLIYRGSHNRALEETGAGGAPAARALPARTVRGARPAGLVLRRARARSKRHRARRGDRRRNGDACPCRNGRASPPPITWPAARPPPPGRPS